MTYLQYLKMQDENKLKSFAKKLFQKTQVYNMHAYAECNIHAYANFAA